MSIGPQSEFQEKYLNSDARLMVVGGSAGSSKSHVGLMRHLRWVDDPFYRGFCIRKNSTAIMKTGGLFDEAVHLYSEYDPKIKIKLKEQKIVFSSGGEIAFSHYENRQAAQLYQGLQISGLLYDEASHAEEEDIWWLLSRMRSRAKMTPSIWLTCNPDPDSYLFDWVKWYLYPEDHELAGRPDPQKNGAIRWLLRKSGDLIWADSREELIETYGDKVLPISFQGLFGTIKDNPTLIKNNPEYLANLESLPRVEKERLLHGNWYARQESTGFWKRQWVTEESEAPKQEDIIKTVRAWDLAGSLPSEALPDPDYSVGVKMSKMRDGTYFIWDVVRFRARFGELTDRIIKIAAEDGARVDIIIPTDPGAAGKAAASMLIRDIAEAGFYARSKSTSKSKVDRFRPFSAVSEQGMVRVLKGCCNDLENKIYASNDWYYTELESFDGGRKGHDDTADSTADAFMSLATRPGTPIFSPPDLSQTNPFKRN